MNSIIALVGRALMSAIFIEAGLGKVMAPATYIAAMSHFDLPLPWAAYGIAVIVEIVGGFAILVGFQIRIVAALLAVYCVATAFIAHDDPGNQEQMIQFMKNICMTGGFMQLVAWGGGRYVVSGR